MIGDLYPFATVRVDGFLPVREGDDGLAIDLLNHVGGLQSGCGRRAVGEDIPDQDSVPRAEVVGQAGGKRLDIDADVVAIVGQAPKKPLEWPSPGSTGLASWSSAARGWRQDRFRGRRSLLRERGAVGELDAEVLRLPVAHGHERDSAAGRGFVQHAAELFNALDPLAIHLDDDIVDLQPRFEGRRVLVDAGDFGAVRVLEL